MSWSAPVTNGGSGGMVSNAGLELPYPQVSQAKFQDKTSCRRQQYNHGEMLICKLASPVHCVWQA